METSAPRARLEGTGRLRGRASAEAVAAADDAEFDPLGTEFERGGGPVSPRAAVPESRQAAAESWELLALGPVGPCGWGC